MRFWDEESQDSLGWTESAPEVIKKVQEKVKTAKLLAACVDA